MQQRERDRFKLGAAPLDSVELDISLHTHAHSRNYYLFTRPFIYQDYILFLDAIVRMV